MKFINSGKSLIIGEIRSQTPNDVTISCTTTNGMSGSPIIDWSTKKSLEYRQARFMRKKYGKNGRLNKKKTLVPVMILKIMISIMEFQFNPQ